MLQKSIYDTMLLMCQARKNVFLIITIISLHFFSENIQKCNVIRHGMYVTEIDEDLIMLDCIYKNGHTLEYHIVNI